ncbi:MAG: restriction endonuclease subunit S, partial [Chlorobiales bacterium]|nr:restriction endonuclease subunit S [Chlorobiales bacterium]
GGIKPHKRFSVQSKRSEVLFVDYMHEHLTPHGRAAIIVPEGIIFQSGTAYKQLRKMLVENSLVAVVSLPAGVFQPYSGVKTSILILDKSLAKQSQHIGFFKVENDGFSLGAQRRPVEKNALPTVLNEVGIFLQALKNRDIFDELALSTGQPVLKEKVAENGEYNLSGERYRENERNTGNWPMHRLGDVAEYFNGFAFKPDDWHGEGIPIIRIQNLTGTSKEINRTRRKDIPEKYIVRHGDLLISWSATIGFYIWRAEKAYLNQHIFRVEVKPQIEKEYLYYLGKRIIEEIEKDVHGNTMQHITKGRFEAIEIPLPPLEVQQEIVAEIEGYQKVIDGARAVIDNYKPQIPIDPEWDILRFKDAPFDIIDGDRGSNYPKKQDFSSNGYCVFLNTKNVRPNGFDFSEIEFITQEKDESLRKGKLRRGDVVLTTRGTIGNTGYYGNNVVFDHVRINSGMLIFRADTTKLSGNYLFHFFQSKNFQAQKDAIISGAAQPQLPIRSLNDAKLPFPPLKTQQAIVAEIEAEQALVNANLKLIERFEKKIQATIARVWGEDEKDSLEEA